MNAKSTKWDSWDRMGLARSESRVLGVGLYYIYYMGDKEVAAETKQLTEPFFLWERLSMNAKKSTKWDSKDRQILLLHPPSASSHRHWPALDREASPFTQPSSSNDNISVSLNEESRLSIDPKECVRLTASNRKSRSKDTPSSSQNVVEDPQEEEVVVGKIEEI
ncbi:hypothetical protein QJS10_CPB22g00024 [Acorus calamus]|uniref:Uncharacterized protein n=1 Tax=Acorus calamus TaxID=4465 RepID=A0AAV9C070_ACOCL|nr:hypothetical protein QJS10_CPB22g00024 [Acorus calamus]